MKRLREDGISESEPVPDKRAGKKRVVDCDEGPSMPPVIAPGSWVLLHSGRPGRAIANFTGPYWFWDYKDKAHSVAVIQGQDGRLETVSIARLAPYKPRQ